MVMLPELLPGLLPVPIPVMVMLPVMLPALLPLLIPVLLPAVTGAGREYSLPYTPKFARCNNPSTEFYDEELNKCCSQCPPGQYRTGSCSHTVDTKCSPCRPKTYTAIWNRSPQCFACSPPCRKGLVQNQTCTRSQDRICSCPPHKYCVSKLDGYCEVCRAHKKCGKGYRVSRRGTDSTDTECKPCPPGTFSPEESYNTSCTPHTRCESVAVPGNSRNDTVCSDSGTATVLPHTILDKLLTQSSASHKPEIITQPVTLNSVPDLSHITGAVAGPLLLVLIIAILGYCLVSKKKDNSLGAGQFRVQMLQMEQGWVLMNCLCSLAALGYSAPATEPDLPFPPPEKQHDKRVRDTELQNSKNSEQEQQHLLETSGSSSSILNNPTGCANISVISKTNNEKKNPGGFQQQHSPPEGSKLQSGDRHSSASSEHCGNGGTQVNVTCIVTFCSPDSSSQCPEQNSSTSRDYGYTPCYSPTGEETHLSKEENALKKETEIHIPVENEDNLLQNLLPEEKKIPLGIQDAGMKTS
ncbi:PREDICTED: tumor necrosis factor receptor superfamily member 1B [Pseudopodoces humilis]|uniref:tumor necrosis factor receptor superfamily member 1B n=1 Tax=Pseudopodoces humilis TaxID=181119 RepID=UPI0006B817AF|nr:PREDICTED: tumor necrosis factor receptor superfamily member 1B [Pseudopodoces humilis]